MSLFQNRAITFNCLESFLATDSLQDLTRLLHSTNSSETSAVAIRQQVDGLDKVVKCAMAAIVSYLSLLSSGGKFKLKSCPMNHFARIDAQAIKALELFETSYCGCCVYVRYCLSFVLALMLRFQLVRLKGPCIRYSIDANRFLEEECLVCNFDPLLQVLDVDIFRSLDPPTAYRCH